MCQVRVFHKSVRWKLWQINIQPLFLNIRVGIRVRGFHLVFFLFRFKPFSWDEWTTNLLYSSCLVWDWVDQRFENFNFIRKTVVLKRKVLETLVPTLCQCQNDSSWWDFVGWCIAELVSLHCILWMLDELVNRCIYIYISKKLGNPAWLCPMLEVLELIWTCASISIYFDDFWMWFVGGTAFVCAMLYQHFFIFLKVW